jgi:hypothetical protein
MLGPGLDPRSPGPVGMQAGAPPPPVWPVQGEAAQLVGRTHAHAHPRSPMTPTHAARSVHAHRAGVRSWWGQLRAAAAPPHEHCTTASPARTDRCCPRVPLARPHMRA